MALQYINSHITAQKLHGDEIASSYTHFSTESAASVTINFCRTNENPNVVVRIKLSPRRRLYLNELYEPRRAVVKVIASLFVYLIVVKMSSAEKS